MSLTLNNSWHNHWILMHWVHFWQWVLNHFCSFIIIHSYSSWLLRLSRLWKNSSVEILWACKTLKLICWYCRSILGSCISVSILACILYPFMCWDCSYKETLVFNWTCFWQSVKTEIRDKRRIKVKLRSVRRRETTWWCSSKDSEGRGRTRKRLRRKPNPFTSRKEKKMVF